MKISKVMVTIIMIFIIIFLICAFLFLDAKFERDAYLYANFTRVSSVESGQIRKIYVKKGSYVKKGQTLFKLDCRYIDKKLKILNSQKEKISVQLKDIVTKITLAKKQRDLALENLAVQKKDFERYKFLIEKRAVSKIREDLAAKNLILSESLYVKADQSVNNLKVEKNDLKSNRKILNAKIDQKKYLLSRCSIKAETNGYVSNFILQKGDFITQGKTLFSIINTDKWFIIANVKESNLKYLSTGKIVDITTSLTGFKKYKGKIVSIEKGINKPQYNNFSALYNIKRNIEWVRLDYRFPVLIEVLSRDTKPFRLGADAHVWF
ncbi:HlyD family secretion protein [Francisella sp. SYW-9]|uniref:HlyD family secretion protein n=1 Tax=Francisella sp. SYW-9 TaxID=2610888 RepID=UPI00123D566A|nr:efflux RND transporter periplasmic adaptor subunit [Francisella sp. SYW-9]